MLSKPMIPSLYNHVQDVPALVWNIQHNIGGYPIVDVFSVIDGVVQKMMPESITYIDPQNCTITFSVARAGFATIV